MTSYIGGVAVGALQPWLATRTADYTTMAAAHSSWIRSDIGWTYVQPTNGAFDFTAFDPVVADTRTNGMRYLAILHTVPDWANGSGGDYALPADADLDLIGEYAYHVGLHFLPQGVTEYEIGNEINLPHPGWTPSGTTYATKWLPQAAAGLRQASTELGIPVTIILGSLAPTEWTGGQDPVTFLTAVYANGGRTLFDHIGWHPYIGASTPEASAHMNADADDLYAVMVANGDSAKKIWATEYGNPTDGPPGAFITEATQADYLTRGFTTWYAKSYAGPLFYYSARDTGTSSSDRELHFGVLRFNGTQKPAYAALSAALVRAPAAGTGAAFRGATSSLQDVTATAVSSTTIPAGVEPGDRVFALVGSGATTPLPVTAQAGWTLLGTYNPTGNFTEQLYYRDVLSSDEAGTTASWTWANTSRTWTEMVAYAGCDLTRVPVYNVTQGAAASAGPHTAPTVVVPAQDWLLTFATARESPGTDTAKSWSITPSTDPERIDRASTNLGTGQKFVIAAYDSAGVLPTGSSGAPTGGVSVGPQARPTNTYNAIVTSAKPFRVGCTVKKDELTYWAPKLAGLDWMRVFPDSDGLPPDWTDSRIQFCRDFDAEVFLSSKIDGDTAKLAALGTFLRAMPAWILNHPDPGFKVWITDRHEPEGDISAAAYKTNSGKFFDMIEALPSNILARLEYGHVLTRQYTENTAGRVYSTHDTGRGTFFGVDMYANSWGSPSTTVATSFPSAATFLNRFKTYQFSGSDHRKRVMPELGGIGIPADTTGSMRAAWYQALHDQMLGWTYAVNGWDFAGYVIWNAAGKSGTSLTGAGTARWFQFDRRHTGTDGSYVILPSVAPPSSGGTSGSTASDRTVSTNIGTTVSHVWSVTVPMTVSEAVDPATVNAWSNLGLPQR